MAEALPVRRPPIELGLSLLVAASPALMASSRVATALVLAGVVTVVLVLTSVALSLVERGPARRVWLVVHLLVVGVLVTAADQLIAGWFPALRGELGVYLPLTGASCVVLSRAASRTGSPGRALLAASGRSAVLAVSLVGLGFARELLGTGAIRLSMDGEPALSLPGLAHAPLVLALLPAGALLLAGLAIAAGRALSIAAGRAGGDK